MKYIDLLNIHDNFAQMITLFISLRVNNKRAFSDRYSHINIAILSSTSMLAIDQQTPLGNNRSRCIAFQFSEDLLSLGNRNESKHLSATVVR